MCDEETVMTESHTDDTTTVRSARLRRDRLAGRSWTPAPRAMPAPMSFEGLLSDPPSARSAAGKKITLN